MHKTLLVLVVVGSFVPTSLALAQQSTDHATGWTAVQAMNAGTTAHVIGKTHSTVCKVAKVDDSSLTCMGVRGSQGEVFPKADIKKIKLPRHAASTLTGMSLGIGAGAGAGAGVGAAQSNSPSIGITKGQATGLCVSIGAVAFGFIGAVVGALTDFMAATIYKG